MHDAATRNDTNVGTDSSAAPITLEVFGDPDAPQCVDGVCVIPQGEPTGPDQPTAATD